MITVKWEQDLPDSLFFSEITSGTVFTIDLNNPATIPNIYIKLQNNGQVVKIDSTTGKINLETVLESTPVYELKLEIKSWLLS